MTESQTKSPRPRRRALRIAGVGLAVLLAAAGVLAATFSPGWIFTPRHDFEDAPAPTPPDYTDDASWAALPKLDDHADLTIEGQQPASAPAAADVFFVHPTTYFSRSAWNAAIDEPLSRELLDEVVLASEASAFNGCCRVYAPRYRQATLGAFYGSASNAAQAFAIAYADVEAAFDAFLARTGDRPFILAGHSQGSMHLMRLLERVDTDPSLRARLVAAYLPGFALPLDQYEKVWSHLRPCETPDQVGCVVAWDTYREDAKVGGTDPLVHWRGDALIDISVDTPRQCTNPVNWTHGGEAPAQLHGGGVAPQHKDGHPSFFSLLMATEPLGLEVVGLRAYPEVEVASRCEDGVLRVPDLGALGFPEQETEPGNYHLHDYELFHSSVRANSSVRVMAHRAALP